MPATLLPPTGYAADAHSAPRASPEVPRIILQFLPKCTLQAILTDPRALPGYHFRPKSAEPGRVRDEDIESLYGQLQLEKRQRVRQVQRQFILAALDSKAPDTEVVRDCFKALKLNARLEKEERVFSQKGRFQKVAEEKPPAPPPVYVEVFAPARDKRLGKHLRVLGENGLGIAWELSDGSYAMKDDEDTLWRWADGTLAEPEVPKVIAALEAEPFVEVSPSSDTVLPKLTPRPPPAGKKQLPAKGIGKGPGEQEVGADSREAKLPAVGKAAVSSVRDVSSVAAAAPREISQPAMPKVKTVKRRPTVAVEKRSTV